MRHPGARWRHHQLLVIPGRVVGLFDPLTVVARILALLLFVLLVLVGAVRLDGVVEGAGASSAHLFVVEVVVPAVVHVLFLVVEEATLESAL